MGRREHPSPTWTASATCCAADARVASRPLTGTSLLHAGTDVLSSRPLEGLPWERSGLGNSRTADRDQNEPSRDDGCPFRSSTGSTVWTVDHVVVVGAGIGGLTASLLLSRVAARVTLVERLNAGHDAAAVIRRPGAFPITHPRLRFVGAEVHDAQVAEPVELSGCKPRWEEAYDFSADVRFARTLEADLWLRVVSLP
jgi:hypothetical protein